MRIVSDILNYGVDDVISSLLEGAVDPPSKYLGETIQEMILDGKSVEEVSKITGKSWDYIWNYLNYNLAYSKTFRNKLYMQDILNRQSDGLARQRLTKKKKQIDKMGAKRQQVWHIALTTGIKASVVEAYLQDKDG